MFVFEVEVYFFIQQKGGFCFHIQSVNLCLFIGELSPLMDINDQWLLVSVILVFIVGDVIVCVFPFFGICCCEIIYVSVFVDVANFLRLEFSL